MSDDFWSHISTGVRVTVAGSGPDKLLGVRDGFRRVLEEGLRLPAEIRIQGREADDGRDPLPVDDDAILRLARSRARELEPEEDVFRVGCEAGLLVMRAEGDERWMVRTWTVVLGVGGEAWGSSGSVQLPATLIEGVEASDLPFHVPGARRRGGMVASMTAGLETRRDAVRAATVLALSSLLYPYLPPVRSPSGRASEAFARR